MSVVPTTVLLDVISLCHIMSILSAIIMSMSMYKNSYFYLSTQRHLLDILEI